MRFKLEKGILHVPNIDLNYLRDFIKSPIKMLVNERKDLPKFTALMVQLRHALEENKLNMKTDTKEKTIEQINAIFDEKLLQENIENSPVIVTLLAPKIGYQKSAELFKESLKSGKTIRELVLLKKLLTEKQMKSLLG